MHEPLYIVCVWVGPSVWHKFSGFASWLAWCFMLPSSVLCKSLLQLLGEGMETEGSIWKGWMGSRFGHTESSILKKPGLPANHWSCAQKEQQITTVIHVQRRKRARSGKHLKNRWKTWNRPLPRRSALKLPVRRAHQPLQYGDLWNRAWHIIWMFELCSHFLWTKIQKSERDWRNKNLSTGLIDRFIVFFEHLSEKLWTNLRHESCSDRSDQKKMTALTVRSLIIIWVYLGGGFKYWRNIFSNGLQTTNE